MFFKYKGTSLAIKLPANAPGGTPPAGASPNIQCFLVWSSLPSSGDIIIDLDVVTYPYAYTWLQRQVLPASTVPLWENSAGPATVGPPSIHIPDLPNALV